MWSGDQSVSGSQNLVRTMGKFSVIKWSSRSTTTRLISNSVKGRRRKTTNEEITSSTATQKIPQKLPFPLVIYMYVIYFLLDCTVLSSFHIFVFVSATVLIVFSAPKYFISFIIIII